MAWCSTSCRLASSAASASTAARGRVSGALFGALLITILLNAMNLIGVLFHHLSLIVKGVVIIAFVAIDGRKKSKR